MSEHEEIAALEQWLRTETGSYARRWEQKKINDLLNNVFGYHAVQIGLPHWDLLQNNRILHKWYTHSQDGNDSTTTQRIICEPEQMPFASESLDLLVLPHVLETSSDPHQILREVQRVLVPEGKVVISGFNPWSLWGMRDRVPGLEPLLPIEPHYHVSPWRAADWLEVLSFDISDEFTGCYRPLCVQSRWLQRWQFMDTVGKRWWPIFGAIYTLKATKRLNSPTMVGLDWSKMPKAIKGKAAAGVKK